MNWPCRLPGAGLSELKLAIFKCPEGGTVAQICEVTGWLTHTVRGTFAGPFKKKLGVTLVTQKPEGGALVRRIA